MKNYNRGKIEVIASTCCNLPSASTGTGTGRMAWKTGEETRNTATRPGQAGATHNCTCTHSTAKAARGVQVQLQLGLLPFLF